MSGQTHNADNICLYVFSSENMQTHGKASGAVNMFGMKNITLWLFKHDLAKYYFVKITLYLPDIEENARMKSTPASSVAMQTLGVVQRVKVILTPEYFIYTLHKIHEYLRAPSFNIS